MALTKNEKSQLIKDFGQTQNDSGSSEVQIACLTSNIKLLIEHCKKNPKDFSSKRGLLKMVCRRTAFLQYLARKNVQRYKIVIEKLGLRK